MFALIARLIRRLLTGPDRDEGAAAPLRPTPIVAFLRAVARRNRRRQGCRGARPRAALPCDVAGAHRAPLARTPRRVGPDDRAVPRSPRRAEPPSRPLRRGRRPAVGVEGAPPRR